MMAQKAKWRNAGSFGPRPSTSQASTQFNLSRLLFNYELRLFL